MRTRPKTYTIGGMTNGSKVMNSTGLRAFGTLKRMTNAVGTNIKIPTMIVKIAQTTEAPKLYKNVGLRKIFVYA